MDKPIYYPQQGLLEALLMAGKKLKQQTPEEAVFIKEIGGTPHTAKPIEAEALPSISKKEIDAPYKSFYNVPNSTASNFVLEVLEAGENIADLPARKKQINRNTGLEVLEKGRGRQINLTNPKTQITIELSDVEKLVGSNKAAKKMFVLALIKANEQAIYGGTLARNYIGFPLQELVDKEFYKTVRTARKGFTDAVDTLTSLKIKGSVSYSKKKTAAINALEVLFTGANIKNGYCTIYLNERINWGFIIQYYTILPPYYFKLPNRASDLLYYIFYLARQNTKEIEERGYFTINFRAIQHRLQLPSENGNTRPQQTIKEPIENALVQIENEHNSYYDNMEFSLLPVYDDTASIADFLDKGYLKVELKGDFSKTFITISKNTAKQINTAQKRQTSITDRAIATNLSKKIETDGKQKDEENGSHNTSAESHSGVE
jgi:hypothetical protein